MTDRDLADIADTAADLCDPRPHVERIAYWDANRNRKHRAHTVVLPGLLTQMADLFEPTNHPDGGNHTPGSRPPANWAALADHTLITTEAARWCWDMRLTQRDTVEGNIRQLVGHAAQLDHDTRAQLATDMRRWRHIAATITGWRTPPATLRAPCPALADGRECAARTLRVNYTTGDAYCATCGTTWTRDSIGILAEYVRQTAA